MLVHAYNIIIDQVIGSIGPARNIVDGLNAMGKKKSINFNDKCATY